MSMSWIPNSVCEFKIIMKCKRLLWNVIRDYYENLQDLVLTGLHYSKDTLFHHFNYYSENSTLFEEQVLKYHLNFAIW